MRCGLYPCQGCKNGLSSHGRGAPVLLAEFVMSTKMLFKILSFSVLWVRGGTVVRVPFNMTL